MQLKICIKRSLAHILCSSAEKWCNFKQRSANIRQEIGSSASFGHGLSPRTLSDS